MIWIQEYWQTIAALTVVGITGLLFLRRLLGARKSTCGGQCACPAKGLAGKAPRAEAD